MNRVIVILTCFAFMTNAAFGATTISPLSPEQERATFQLADTNLTIELVAAEPDVRAPVAIAWDADGRMFVAEMTDYPSGPTSGRIRLLEDADNDGRYERATIFATNLAFPNGVMAWKGGVLVTAAPDIWFLADTNSDGVSDRREKILTGFAEGNQQLRVNGLFWGIDNWIYGANGRSDGEVRWAIDNTSVSIRRHDFRFRPDTKQFEAIAGNSQFGMGHDDWGNRFPVFNNTPIRHVVMEERYLERQPLLAGTDVVPSISPTNDGNRVFALTPPTLLIPQAVGFFTSACGPSIFRGMALPESYRGNYFVCEPVQNVVQRRVLKPNGSTFIAEYADEPREFLASTDRWFHGVFTATGPDGALYIVDFYRDLVEHPHWVAPELRDKIDWRKGEEHGRIWRVRAKSVTLAKMEKLSPVSKAALVDALESDNGWTRDTAHRLLVERDAKESVPGLRECARHSPKPQARVHALSLLGFFNVLTDVMVREALSDSNPRVREHAVRLSWGANYQFGFRRIGTMDLDGLRWSALLAARDPDARVRLEVAPLLGEWLRRTPETIPEEEWRQQSEDFLNGMEMNQTPPFDLRRTDVLTGLVRVARHKDLDQWQALAILGSRDLPAWPLLERIADGLSSPTEAQRFLLERLAQVVGASINTPDKERLIAWLERWQPVERIAVAAAFVEGLASKEKFLKFGDGRIARQVISAAEQTVRDESVPLSVRLSAVRLLEAEPCEALLRGNYTEEVQVAAARVLITANHAEAVRWMFDHWTIFAKSLRRQIVSASARTRTTAIELERAVALGNVPLIEVDPVTRQALEKFNDPEVRTRALELFQRSISPDRDAVVQKYRAALKVEADHKRGAALFERTCTVCHQMQGVGAKVGPDLSAVGQHARETLLVDILDPSRQVLPDFVAYLAETTTGDIYTGFIANESAKTVTLRRPNEPDVTLQRSQLKEFKTSGKSLMPDGLEAGMSEQDMADLIEFLRRPDRTLFSESVSPHHPSPR